VLIPSLYATSSHTRFLRPIRVSSDQNTRWRLSFPHSTNKRQEFIIFPISPYLLDTMPESGRLSRRRTRVISNLIRKIINSSLPISLPQWLATNDSLTIEFSLIFLYNFMFKAIYNTLINLISYNSIFSPNSPKKP